MTKKSDKFGIKFWLAADVEFKYIPNAIPYLGKDEARPATQRLSESVVIKIVEPYLGKEKKLQLTNFLLRLILPPALEKKKSLVGTLNKIQSEVQQLLKALQQNRYFSL